MVLYYIIILHNCIYYIICCIYLTKTNIQIALLLMNKEARINEDEALYSR